jgi:hypothetical protein
MLPTLQRLQELPAGAKMVAYIGNLEYDIARCDKMSPIDSGAPTYKAVLTRLQEGLHILHHAGRISVNKIERQQHRTSNKGKTIEWRDYIYEVTKLS